MDRKWAQPTLCKDPWTLPHVPLKDGPDATTCFEVIEFSVKYPWGDIFGRPAALPTISCFSVEDRLEFTVKKTIFVVRKSLVKSAEHAECGGMRLRLWPRKNKRWGSASPCPQMGHLL